MKVRFFVLFLATGLLLCGLAGCGGRELHQRLLIQAIGIDTGDQGVAVTVRAASTGQEAGDQLYTCQGATVPEALSSLTLSTGREPFYAHCSLVVLGRSCGEAGLSEFLDFFLRGNTVRPTAQVLLSTGTASQILSAKRDSELLPVGDLTAPSQAGRDTGMAFSVDLLELVNSALRPGSSPVLPLVEPGGDAPQLAGSAYFRDLRLAGTFTLEETRGLLALRGWLESGELALEREIFGTVTLGLTQGKTQRALTWEGDLPQLQVRCQVRAELLSLDGPASQNLYSQLEQALAQALEEEMSAALEKALADGCDVLGLGNLVSQRRPQAWRELAPRWETVLSQCGFQLEAQAQVQPREEEGL